MSMFSVFNIAGSALTAQSLRLNAVASNMANADSVAGPDGKPYRAKQVVFEATLMGLPADRACACVRWSRTHRPPEWSHDPRNPAANDQGYVAMSNVNAVEEMENMISASRSTRPTPM